MQNRLQANIAPECAQALTQSVHLDSALGNPTPLSKPNKSHGYRTLQFLRVIPEHSLRKMAQRQPTPKVTATQ